MYCNKCGKHNPPDSKFCQHCGEKLSVESGKQFTPEDLKKHWPGKYDDWAFELNGRKEWIGYFKKQMGIIVANKDKSGNEFPDLKLREAVSTGGFGLNSLSIGWGNFRKAKK